MGEASARIAAQQMVMENAVEAMRAACVGSILLTDLQLFDMLRAGIAALHGQVVLRDIDHG
jgi:hypothetical protein